MDVFHILVGVKRYRISRSDVFCKNGVLTEAVVQRCSVKNVLVKTRVSFLIIKKRLLFSCDICYIFKNTFNGTPLVAVTVLKNFTKFTGLFICRSKTCNFWKRDADTGVFLWVLRNFKNTFLQKTSVGRFWRYTYRWYTYVRQILNLRGPPEVGRQCWKPLLCC